MFRRSSRLVVLGYYNNEGQPIVCYKENIYKPFKSRRKLRKDPNSSNSTSPTRLFPVFVLPLSLVFVYMIVHQCRNHQSLAPLKLNSLSAMNTTMNTMLEGMKKHLKSLKEWYELWFGRQNKLPQELQDELEKNRELWKLMGKMNYLPSPSDMLPNYALESLGARIMCEGSSETYQTVQSLRSRRTVIQGQSHLLPGHCWAFAGEQGKLSIALSYNVTISYVTLGHMSKMLSPTGEIFSAPREFSVYGKENLDDQGIHLGNFIYNKDGDSFQAFKLLGHEKEAFKFVILQVNSNWGNPDHTCIYSFRVHGRLQTE